jgi:alkylhydroperoxidase/carboxymuconolactone decarboxylase family protein YurZ
MNVAPDRFTPEQIQIKQRFIKVRGYWNEFWDALLMLDPDFFESYLQLSSIPWSKGPLERKIKEFICIAIDASTTHLYEPGLRIHVQNALSHGVAKDEIMEVLQLTSTLGLHTIDMGLRVLTDEMKALDFSSELDVPHDEQRISLKEQFETCHGYWNDAWNDLLTLDPNFFSSYLDFSAFPWRKGRLEPKIKELILIAINASTTHLYEPGLRIHVRNALKFGATIDEIMQVYQLVSGLGMHTCTMGVPVLVEEGCGH